MNRKTLFLTLLMALSLPLTMMGQTMPIVVDDDHPFIDGFEGDTCSWTFINGNSINAWAWGQATNNGGSHSIYISQDGGVSNTYHTGASTWVYVTKDFSFEEGYYTFAYDWKAAGEGSCDYIRVGLLPVAVTLSSGSGLPNGWLTLDDNSNLNGNSSWTTKTVVSNYIDGNYKMVFAWRNDGSAGSNPPGAIDNVSISKLVFDQHTSLTQTSTSDFLKGTCYNADVITNQVSLQNKMSSMADWSATTNLPQTLKGHQMVVWRNFVYLVGGFNGSNVTNAVYRATQQDNGVSGWTSINALPEPLRDMSVVVTQTQLVVIGGRNNDAISNKIYAAPFNEDGSIGAWHELPFSLSQPCWGMCAVEALGNIYIVGGANTNSDNDATNIVFRLIVNACGEIIGIDEVNSLPEPRNGHAVTVYDSKIMVTGGYDSNHSVKNTVYSAVINFDGSLGQWQEETSLPIPIFNHTVICTNGVIAVIGGQDANMPSNRVYCTSLDGVAFSWDLLDIMLPERFTEGSAFAFGNKIFFGGGQSLAGTLDNGLRYMAVNTTNEPVHKAAFIGFPYDVGAPKELQQLTCSLDYSPSSSYEILYRTAEEDKVFGDWVSAGDELPVVINQTKSFIQYMFRVTATGEEVFSIEDVTLTMGGYCQLAGDLNWMSHITLENSPYLVTSDISFTSGTHQIEAGVIIQFMPNTAMNIGRASVNFNGTEANPILLTSNGGEGNNWNGVYFQDASDNGVSSVMNYTTIEKAGYSDNNANLRLYYTNQPTICHCTFSRSDGHGLRLDYSSPVIASCNFDNNSESGLFLNNSSPTCTDCVMNGNDYSGIYYATANSNANLVGVTVSNNLYGLFSNTPDRSFTFDESIIEFNDNGSDIAIAAGRIASNQTWNSYSNGYAILGNVEIYGGAPKLTIAPNTTIKVKSGYSIYVGRNSSEGGMLYAVGAASAPITFTSLNGEVGGWNGLNFRDGSDYNSASSLRYCVVEKASTNLYCANTNQPGVLRCSFQNASSKAMELSSANITVEETVLKDSPYGLSIASSQPTLISDTIRNTTAGCVYIGNAAAAPNYYTCTFKDSPYGVRYYTPDLDLSDVDNVSFENINFKNAVNGGDIVNNRQWNVSAVAVLGTVRIGSSSDNNYRRLTLSPGTTLAFAEGTGMQVSWFWHRGGELYAVGTAEAPIIFTAMNGENGGWNGLYFYDHSDDVTGIESILEHCIIEKGNTYNLMMDNTNQPSQINNCIFRDAIGCGAYIYGSTNMTDCQVMDNGSDGIYFKNSNSNMVMTDCEVHNNGGHGVKSETAYLSMHNVLLTNNGGYGMYYTNAHYMNIIDNVEIEGNALGQVAMDGGDITANRTWNAYNYHILGTVRVGSSSDNNYSRLILLPGTALAFAEGTSMQFSWYWNRGGELYAVGTEEAPITFTALNGESGGWNGLYFNDYSDFNSAMSSILEHCVIEKGNTYNLYMENTNQPSQINHCTFRDALGKGVHVINGSPIISDCQVLNNGGDGIKSETAMLQLHDVTISGNGGYGMYYNNAYYMNVLENVSIEGNTIGQVALGGSDITANRTWNAYNYHVLGTVRVGSSSDNNYRRLTLLPGTTLAFAEGTGMQLSWSWNRGGELYAVGTEEAPITFTALNGESGGWNGLYFNDYSDFNSAMSSILEHCIIEKGNTYNLYMENTNQPSQIRHCTFRDAVGYGVQLNNASPALSNSIIMNNVSYGLYLTGNSAPVVGASAENSCDIYKNGGFNVYQDGTSNLNMRYNFMGNPDSLYVDQHLVYDQIDNSTKGKVNYMPLSFLPSNTAVSGTLLYDANPNKPITGQTLVVEDIDHNVLYEAEVDVDGGYTIPEAIGMFNRITLQPGFDVLEGVNATDALLTMRHFVHLDELEGQHASVADVNANGIINGTDALLILRRTLGNSFPAGDYAFTADTLTFDGEVLNYPLSVMLFGDVNASYTPHNRDFTMELVQDGLVLIGPNQEVELPVHIKTTAEMGALTLHFGYPEEYLEIENVTLAATGENLLFAASDGVLKTGWYNLSPVALNEDDLLLNITVHTKDFAMLDEPIGLSLSAFSELADGVAQVVSDVVIAMPMMTTLTLNTQDNGWEETLAVAVYPNPAKDQCTLTYQTEHEGRVTVSVYDVTGVKRMSLSDTRMEAGSHQLQLSTSGLAAGVYYCRITLEGEANVERVIKLIVEK